MSRIICFTDSQQPKLPCKFLYPRQGQRSLGNLLLQETTHSGHGCPPACPLAPIQLLQVSQTTKITLRLPPFLTYPLSWNCLLRALSGHSSVLHLTAPALVNFFFFFFLFIKAVKWTQTGNKIWPNYIHFKEDKTIQ